MFKECLIIIILMSSYCFTLPVSAQIHNYSDGVQTAWIRNFSSGGSITPIDEAVAMAVDDFGNIYVTGQSSSVDGGAAYTTVKYDSEGIERWVGWYNGPGGIDNVSAIDVDYAGNMYVTGASWSRNKDFDYATVKYNPLGEEQWVARYSGPADSRDEATAIAVDQSGNVYVTGWSAKSLTDSDYNYVTIKYNHDGVEQWVVIYDSPGEFRDQAVALAVDQSGTVYVTGTSTVDFGSDYATVKYNAEGIEQWVANYNGPGNFVDQALDIGLDRFGNIYVTGTSDSDYATIKYNSSGVELWVARYDKSIEKVAGLAIDNSGQVYVTGRSSDPVTSRDFATVKYNSSGILQWVSEYKGPGNSSDEPTAITLDETGNVYVTGWSGAPSHHYVTIKYDSSGAEQWLTVFDTPGIAREIPVAIAVDHSGDVYVTGESSIEGNASDYTTVKYSTEGIEQWAARYNGPTNSLNSAVSLAVDESGNVYATGYSSRWGTSFDYATVKYDAFGEREWVTYYAGPGDSWDKATAIAVDQSGNVYVTGWSWGAGVSRIDYVTVKYNSSGIEQWINRYNGPGDLADKATALALDGSGNVYVTGTSSGSGTSRDYATIKYNPSGVEEWVARYDGPKNASDFPTALAVNNAGNVYVTGTSWGASWDYATVKYDSAGVEQWVARFNHGQGSVPDEASAIAVDQSGNVYVTGKSSDHYTTVKYNSSGKEEWVSRYTGPGNTFEEPAAIGLDLVGNVYVTGSIWTSTPSRFDYLTVKYNSAGVEQWAVAYNGPLNSEDRAAALAIDASGDIYVTGYTVGPGTELVDHDYATVKYSSSGEVVWVALYSRTGNSNDRATALVLDGSGNVYVTGTSGGGNWSSYSTIKYVQTPTTSVEEREDAVPRAYWLLQNYPNPFNPSTTIRYAIPKPEHVMLKIFNILGEEIAILVNERKSPGEYKVQFNAIKLPSGMYIYRLQAGEFVESKELILLK